MQIYYRLFLWYFWKWFCFVLLLSVVDLIDVLCLCLELNRLENLGEKTRDLGGLSFIGDGITNTIVKNNCVKNVIGFDTNPNGTILTPFFNWGIYLDNDASGFLVEGNVVNTNVNGGVFFHGGKDNMVRNNIFINSHVVHLRGPSFSKHFF